MISNAKYGGIQVDEDDAAYASHFSFKIFHSMFVGIKNDFKHLYKIFGKFSVLWGSGVVNTFWSSIL